MLYTIAFSLGVIATILLLCALNPVEEEEEKIIINIVVDQDTAKGS